MSGRILTAFVLLGVLIGAFATARVPVGDGPADLESLVAGWQDTSDVDAVVVAVGRPGEFPQVIEAGSAQADDRFRIGSITKTFVAATVLRLAEEGVLSVEDRLDRWVEEPVRFGGVTLRQLLGHTSGVPEYTASGDFFEQLDRAWTPDQMIDSTAGQAPSFEPGTDWQYSNTNYILLGQVIEAATGRAYGDVMREQVLDRAGLSPGIGTDVDVTVPGWFDMDFDGTVDDVSRNPYLASVPWAAGQMVSTAGDLARFSTVLQTGGVLSEDSLQAMWDEGAFGQRYGFGLSWSTPDGSTDVVGHSGSVIGYTAVMWWVPSLETSIVVLLNDSRLGDPTDLAELVLRRLVTDGTPPEP